MQELNAALESLKARGYWWEVNFQYGDPLDKQIDLKLVGPVQQSPPVTLTMTWRAGNLRDLADMLDVLP